MVVVVTFKPHLFELRAGFVLCHLKTCEDRCVIFFRFQTWRKANWISHLEWRFLHVCRQVGQRIKTLLSHNTTQTNEIQFTATEHNTTHCSVTQSSHQNAPTYFIYLFTYLFNLSCIKLSPILLM